MKPPAPWIPGRDRYAVRHDPRPTRSRAIGSLAVNRPERPRVLVVGGGIAGLAAAVALAERGVEVRLVEREETLGGRVRSWEVADGRTMSRGFHAFFRQYYTLRSLLRRVDPTLAALRPIADYPLQLADGPRDSFARIPRRPPWSMVGFVARSPSFPLSALPRVDVGAALELLRVRFPESFSHYDGVSANQVLDRLRFPDQARHLALEVFARSFFAHPDDFSGAELVAMFHTYFLGSAEGLLFDVPVDDYDSVLWAPLGRYLTGLGAQVATGVSLTGLDEDAAGVRAELSDGSTTLVDGVVLATDRAPLQSIVEQTTWLGDPDWRERVLAQRSAPAFLVWRRWLDRSEATGTPEFLGTSGYDGLDNITMVHQFEAGARDWARRTGGSVVELHAYACGERPEADLRRVLAAAQDQLHPELADAHQVHEEWLLRSDCPLVDTSPWADRPGADTPDPRVVLAGDGIRCDLPVALMERAAVTGMQAANSLLHRFGRPGHEIWSVPMAGLLAR